jgi:hypothetical protein
MIVRNAQNGQDRSNQELCSSAKDTFTAPGRSATIETLVVPIRVVLVTITTTSLAFVALHHGLLVPKGSVQYKDMLFVVVLCLQCVRS